MKKDRLSYSALSNFAKSPNHLLSYWQQDFEPTPAMLFGSLLHKMILQPETFSHDYAIYEGRRAGKDWIEFKEHNKTKNIVTGKEYNMANKVFNKAKEDTIFKKLLMQTTETEKHLEWSLNDVNYHGYCDMIGETFIADIKTTTDAGDKFARDLLYNNYKLQAAMYLSARPLQHYYIIAVEKSEPYNVQVYELGEELLDKGLKQYIELNEKYKQWNGEPQSYNNGIIKIGEYEKSIF